ncbi:hypothetical protein [Xenorhabdus sp. TH1]|uniref:hypothetical protein n=1 Tax=Xenorhabdus sp. TH1 TaxID=3130166 RepID=UPI0030D0ADDF
MGVITQSLTSSINRFFIASLQTNNIRDANIIFNTALIVIVFYAVIQFLFIYYPVQDINKYISIPSLSVEPAILLFESILISFSIALLTSIFSVSLFALNRIDFIQCVSLLKVFLKFISIIAFFNNGYIGIQYVGYAMIIAEISALIMTIFLWKKLTPNININIKLFSKDKVGEISKFALWLIIDQIGYVLFIKMDLLLVNKFFGAKESGRYSIATQFSDLLRSFAGLIAGVLSPVIMILHAKNEFESIITVTKAFVMVLSLTIAIPVSIICIFSNELIYFWIGQQMNIDYLMWVIMLPLIINLGVLPFFSINVAFKKVKIPALLNVVLALFGILISFILIRFTELQVLSIAIGFSVALTVKNAIFIPIYAAMNLSLNKLTFLGIHIRTVLFSASYMIILYSFKSILSSKLDIFLLELILLGILGGIASVIFYARDERKYLINMILKKLNK